MNEFTAVLLGYAIGLAICAAVMFCYDKYKERGYLIDTKKRKAARAAEERKLVEAMAASFAAQSACILGIAMIKANSKIQMLQREKEWHEREQKAWEDHIQRLSTLKRPRLSQ